MVSFSESNVRSGLVRRELNGGGFVKKNKIVILLMRWSIISYGQEAWSTVKNMLQKAASKDNDPRKGDKDVALD